MNEDLKELIDRFLMPEAEGFFAPLEAEIGQHDERIASIASNFKEGLATAIRVGSIPFLLVSSAVTQQMLQRYSTVERIRSLKLVSPGESLTVELEERATELAVTRLRAKESGIELRDATLNRMKAVVFDGQTSRAAAELLAQTVVMLWATFEVLFSDIVRCKLNSDPKLALKLISQDPARRHFSRTIGIDALAEQAFNVQASMGDVLLGERSLDSLPLMKDVASVFFPANAVIHKHFADQSFWILWQRRNLIVHRRGQVDQRYVATTGDVVRPGTRLDIRASYVESVAEVVRDTAIAVQQSHPMSSGRGFLDHPRQRKEALCIHPCPVLARTALLFQLWRLLREICMHQRS
jgi:hypothetical protein